MDINIGNDIRVNFMLDSIVPTDRLGIRSLECFFLNVSDHGLVSHISNLFGEPFPQYFNPTPYTIRSCNYPTYNVNPVNMGRHMWDCFCGFGVNTRRVECCHHHCGHNTICVKPYHCIIPDGWTTEKPLSVIFPACDQIKLGSYRFVVKITTYEEGWGYNNLHDYTIDFGSAFRIVKHDGVSGIIDLDFGSNREHKSPDPTGNIFVDLGLPSGRLWAKCNIGAESQEKPGLYFQYGSFNGYSNASHSNWATFPFDVEGVLDEEGLSKWHQEVFAGGKIKQEYDPCLDYYGVPCRMPDNDDIRELMENTVVTEYTINGVTGIRLTSKTNGNYIFMPLSGSAHEGLIKFKNMESMWSATENVSDYPGQYAAEQFYFSCSINDYGDDIEIDVDPIYIGNCIRAVK